MSTDEILHHLQAKNIALSIRNGRLVVRGEEQLVDDPALVSLLRENRQALIELIQTGKYGETGTPRRVSVPPNRIPAGCRAMTPEMLSMVALTAAQIETLVAQVPGGVPNIQDVYPLTPLQEGILFHHLMADDDPYVLSGSVAFSSREDLDAALRALEAALGRHDILRTAIFWEKLPEPLQVVLRKAVLRVEEVSLDASATDAVNELHQRFDGRRFKLDLHQAPLARVFIAYDQNERRWLLLLLLHHLVGDHATLALLQEEIEAYLQGRGGQLPAPVPFRNFVAEARLGVTKNEHETYFRQMLGDVDEPTAPFGLLELHGDTPQVREAALDLPVEVALRIRRQARQHGVSTASLCHLAWAEVLARVSGRNDIVFGTVLFGRMNSSEGVDRVMGPCINTLPLRIRIDRQEVAEEVRHTHKLLAELVRHEHASLALAQRSSAVPAPTPLFSSILNYRHSTVTPADRTGKRLQWVGAEERTNYPVTLSVDDLGVGLRLAAQVFEPIDPIRICRLMETALARVASALEQAPKTPLNTLDVLPAEERRLVLYGWNDTAAPFTTDACVHQLFEKEAVRSPEAVALVFEGRQLCYDELNRRANQLAHYLRQLGVRPDDRVALCLERSFEMVIALLAVWKAGGAYVPLDPVYPAERLAYLLEDSQPRVLITQATCAARLPEHTALPVMWIDDADRSWAVLPSLNPAVAGLRPQHMAYVIYTSGSTGQPKGVMVTHRNVVNLLESMRRMLAIGSDDRLLAVTTLGFDIAGLELYLPLIVGARAIVLDHEASRNAEVLTAALSSSEATVMQATPSTWRLLVESGWAGRPDLNALCGGEPLPAELARQLRPRVGRLWNVYGPTETTIWSSAKTITSADEASPLIGIGRPIANTQIYLLDAHGEPVPVGVVGEIHIGGDGVARGYLNRPELTAERFVVNPFRGEGRERMYKTGDLGRWLPDGTIEFLGRNDHQVKVRGFRIELGEIEARLAEHPDIRQAVVLAREDQPGDPRLVAYIVPKQSDGGDAPATEELRAYLSRRLPDYMVPALYVRLEAIPLTPNGKFDRKALPAPEATAYPVRAYEPPAGETEELLTSLFTEVLQVERVGRNHNFFELGGHSLLAVRLIERMRSHGLEADVRTIFIAPTLARLAAAVAHDEPAVQVPPNGIPSACSEITPEMLPLVALTGEEIATIVSRVPGGAANVQDIYGLAPLQEGIFFHHLIDKTSDPYLLTAILAFDSRERLDSYLEAIQRVIDRHDILRTAIFWEDLPEPVQVVLHQAKLPVEEVQLEPDGADSADQLYTRLSPRHYRIDLGRAPLLRFFSAYDSKLDRWLLMQMHHHLVGDHSSLHTIHGEIRAFLSGRQHQLPASLPFRNLVAQARFGVSREEHEAFFREMLGDLDEPTAPFGLLEASERSAKIEEAELQLESTLSRRLRRSARNLSVSAASLFHLAWAQVVARLSTRNDVVFGTVLFGRMHSDGWAHHAVGLFINTLPLRVQIDGRSVEEGVRHMQALLAGLLRHEHASLALAQRSSSVPAPTPLFSALLNYRHNAGAALPSSEEGLEGVEALVGEERTNYPLLLSVDDLGQEFRLVAQADTGVDPARICLSMQQALRSLVTVLEQAPRTRLNAIDVLPAEEHRLLVYGWNDTAAPFPTGVCIHQLFENQVLRSPESVALVFEDQQLSFHELNRRANQLAHYLRQLGVRPDTRVALCLERSFEMVIALLAVWKAGGAYVPLDPDYPQERLRFLLEDAAPVALLTQTHLAGRFHQAIPVLPLDSPSRPWASQPHTNPDPAGVDLRPQHLAYIIYTSGSTGTPKGVMVEHRSLVNRIVWMQSAYGLNQHDAVLQKTPYTFDVSVLEFVWPLLAGTKLVIARPEGHKDPAYLRQLIQQHQITTVHFVPSMLQVFLNDQATREYSCLLRVISAGEALSGALAKRFQQLLPGTALHNLYGPTEATVYVTAFACPPRLNETNIPIGRPIANTAIYILDAQHRPAPIGVAGELYIGGMGVARGYLNRPELTAERFLPDPFRTEVEARMYKTGDLGRWLPDGNIELLGRNDFQVKIRGFRVELGEIEARLAEHAGVREVVVIARQDQPDDQRLVAYVVPKQHDGNDGLRAEELRAYLSRRLPDYMVPALYVRLEAMPLTSNGKLDRKALPAPDANAPRGYVAPQGEAELLMSEIWARVLGLAKVGRHDNFFELGGHSLLAVKVIEQLRRHGVRADIRVLFNAPHLADFSAAVHSTGPEVKIPPNLIPTTNDSHEPSADEIELAI